MTHQCFSSAGATQFARAMVCAFCFATFSPLMGAQALADEGQGADEKAVLATVASYVAAYNKQDAKAVATHWSETGEWVSPTGERHQGKAAIEKALAEMFADSGDTTIEVIDPTVRLIAADAAIERGTVIVRAAGEDDAESSYVAVHVKRDGKWKLDSVYETAAVEDAPAPTPLQDLAWLVGEWTDASPEAEAVTSVTWMKNKSFLNYSFQISAPDADDLQGTQVIGWHPETGSIHSWMFDSDGGLGEGTWTKSGDSWIVKLTQVLPDGRRASATNIYTPVDTDTIVWKSIGRKLDGEFLANIDDVKLVRRRAAVASSDTSSPTTPTK